MKTKYILAMSGSDVLSGGGLQADLATFTSQGLFGFLALTSLATVGREGFEITPIATELFVKQLTSLAAVPFAAIKLGLLPNRELAEQALNFVKERPDVPCVLDPVLVFKENADEEISQMKEQLLAFFPHVTVITPNLREAEILSGVTITKLSDMKKAAQVLYELGAKYVVIKGGSRLDKHQALDLYSDGQDMFPLALPILHDNNNGAGCTFASSLASQLAQGQPMLAAVKQAKSMVYQAIEQSNEYGVQPHDIKN